MSPLWVHAHENEARGIESELDPRLPIGTGKVAAAVALSRSLATHVPDHVVAFGVAGAYPGRGLAVGDVCLVGTDALADEGVRDEQGFRDLAELELGEIGPFRADRVLTERYAQLLGAPVVTGATVSTCSATDAASVEIAARTGAAVETMEGAAIAAACAAAGVPWVQLRAISNLTGDRLKAGWELERAVGELHTALRALLAACG